MWVHHKLPQARNLSLFLCKYYIISLCQTEIYEAMYAFYLLRCVRSSCWHPGSVQCRVEDCCCFLHFSLARGMGIGTQPHSLCHLSHPCGKLAWLFSFSRLFSLSNLGVRLSIQGSTYCHEEIFQVLQKVLNPTFQVAGWRFPQSCGFWNRFNIFLSASALCLKCDGQSLSLDVGQNINKKHCFFWKENLTRLPIEPL